MMHSAFQDGSTAYGYLTWMNSLTCAPRAIRRSCPDGLSEATDCGDGDCSHECEAGAWSAFGAQGQLIIGHPGMDLVIVGHNRGLSGGSQVWQTVLPAIVVEDPVYRGDGEAFCPA